MESPVKSGAPPDVISPHKSALPWPSAKKKTTRRRHVNHNLPCAVSSDICNAYYKRKEEEKCQAEQERQFKKTIRLKAHELKKEKAEKLRETRMIKKEQRKKEEEEKKIARERKKAEREMNQSKRNTGKKTNQELLKNELPLVAKELKKELLESDEADTRIEEPLRTKKVHKPSPKSIQLKEPKKPKLEEE
uniref:Stress response protein NST1-like n=1 Tax=Bracon brevicornis TaxID=1563983 RepID=A0A6V7J7S3_9HYME